MILTPDSAACEKQIMTPSNGILYCSEAYAYLPNPGTKADCPRCRRKDDTKPMSASILSPPFVSDPGPATPQHIIPARFPTGSPGSTAAVARIPPDHHGFRPDLDPTEWKPKLIHRGSSEAYRYLSTFHASLNKEVMMTYRPRFSSHKSTTSLITLGTATTPSLGNSPTTAASSFDSVYEFNTRPLLPRHNPMYALSGATKSADLITPHIPPPVEISITIPDNHKWEKRMIEKGPKLERDGLRAMIKGSK